MYQAAIVAKTVFVLRAAGSRGAGHPRPRIQG